MTPLDSRTSQAITLADQVAEQMFTRFGRRIPLDDLQSLARSAAVDAANRWDGRGTFARFVVQRTRWGVCGAIRVRRRLPAHPTPESLHTTAALATERAADAQAQAENDPGFLGTAEEAPVFGMAALTASRVARLGAFLGRAAADFAVSLDAAEVTALADEQVDVEAETDRMRLRRAVMALPPQERVVVERHSYQGETFEEIAATEGHSTSTLFSRFSRAMESLRRAMGSRRGDEE